jgi:hypothetical protein
MPGTIDLGNGINFNVLAVDDPGFFKADQPLIIKDANDKPIAVSYGESQAFKHTAKGGSGTTVDGKKLRDDLLFPIQGQTGGKMVYTVIGPDGKIVTEGNAIQQANAKLKVWAEQAKSRMNKEQFEQAFQQAFQRIGEEYKVQPKIYTKAMTVASNVPKDSNPKYQKQISEWSMEDVIDDAVANAAAQKNAGSSNWFGIDQFVEIGVFHDPKNLFERRHADGNNNLEAQELAQASVTAQSGAHNAVPYNNQSFTGVDTPKTQIQEIRLQ